MNLCVSLTALLLPQGEDDAALQRFLNGEGPKIGIGGRGVSHTHMTHGFTG